MSAVWVGLLVFHPVITSKFMPAKVPIYESAHLWQSKAKIPLGRNANMMTDMNDE